MKRSETTSFPARNAGQTDFPEVLRAIGEVQTQLALGTHRAVVRREKDLANAPPDAGAAGLPGQQSVVSLAAKAPREELRLGGLARSFGSLECDEEAQPETEWEDDRRSPARAGQTAAPASIVR